METTIEIKPWEHLTCDELYDLLQLRIAVFVVEQNCPYQEADQKDKKSTHVLMRDSSGQLVGCTRLVRPGVSYPEWSIGRVAVALSHRSKHLGQRLMQASLEHLKATTNSAPIRISAQFYLLQFYQKCGFQQVSDIYLEDNIPHVEMLLTTYPDMKDSQGK
jgi:ElaA protein